MDNMKKNNKNIKTHFKYLRLPVQPLEPYPLRGRHRLLDVGAPRGVQVTGVDPAAVGLARGQHRGAVPPLVLA